MRSTRANPVNRRALGADKIAQLMRGFFLPTALIRPDAAPWDLRRIVTKARATAVSLSRANQRTLPIFTMETALILHGLPTWTDAPPLQSWRFDGRTIKDTRALPPVQILGRTVPSTTHHNLQGRRLGTGSVEVGGVLTVPLVEAAVDMARFAHPLPALAAVTNVLRHLSEFSRFSQGPARVRAEKVRRQMLDLLETVRGTRFYRRAKTIILAADPGLESMGEVYVWWQLHALTHASASAGQFVSQQHLYIHQREFFLDVSFPNQKCCIEFDGAAKIDSRSDAGRRFLSRQVALTNAGWSVFRVTSEDVRRPVAAAQKIGHQLLKWGIASGAPTGPLWRTEPQETFQFGRH